MATLSPARKEVPQLQGLELINRGKVRDTYRLPDDKLLSVATDGISIFDFVLNALVPEKGYVLTAMTHYWAKALEENGVCKTHLVAAGAAIDEYLPGHLRGNTDLQRRAVVVDALTMAPVEFIARGYITGSVLSEYKRTGTVYGVELPGLQDGDKLPSVLDTPTTKATEGHDEPLSRDEVREKFPGETDILLKAYSYVHDRALKRGIIFADTKFELGCDKNGQLILGDEIATPDSSRFWDALVWEKSRKADTHKVPAPFDKQMVRAWGIEQGVSKKDPKVTDDVAAVQSLVVPNELIQATTAMYRYIFWRLTGTRLEKYQSSELGITVPPRKRHVAVIFGSKSDYDKVVRARQTARRWQNEGHASFEFRALSCHRNPYELVEYVKGLNGTDTIVGAGGMALALPGVLDAFLHASGKQTPVIGVALGEPGSEDLLAAQLSISRVPGQPIFMDEIKGVYTGEQGLIEAIERATFGEVPPVARQKRVAEVFTDF